MAETDQEVETQAREWWEEDFEPLKWHQAKPEDQERYRTMVRERRWTGNGSRREAMWVRYGVPKTADTAEALRTIGRRQEVHPKDAIAFLYANQEAADAYAATNLEHHGHQTLGSYATAEGVIGVIDIREAQAALGRDVTDPAEAD